MSSKGTPRGTGIFAKHWKDDSRTPINGVCAMPHSFRRPFAAGCITRMLLDCFYDVFWATNRTKRIIRTVLCLVRRRRVLILRFGGPIDAT